MGKHMKRITNKTFLIILAIVIMYVILSFNPRLQKINFELQTDKFHINTEARYETLKEKATEINTNQ